MAPPPTQRVIDLLADAFQRAAVNVHEQTSPVTQAHRIDAERAHLDRMEDEMTPTTGQIVALFDGLDLPDNVRAVLNSAVAPEHAGQFFSLINNVILAFVFQVMGVLVPPLLQDAANDTWSKFQAVPLAPAEVALNELRGGTLKGRGAAEAALSGINPARYEQLLYNTGEPPAIQEMLFLFRRGLIDQPRLERAIRQSRIRDEWIDAVEMLQYVPPSAAEAVAAAVQGHMDPATSQQVVAENGIDPKWWQIMYDTAGRPPGVMQLLALENRNLVDEATVTEAIRESDIKNKYIPAILQMRRHLMPQRTVVSAIHQGVLDAGTAVGKLQELGYSAEDAAILAAEGSATKVAGAKHLAQSIVVKAYRDQMIDAGTATADLAALGYDAAEAGFILAVADTEWEHALEDQAVSVVRGQYVRRHVDAGQAGAALDAIGIPALQRDRLLQLWQIERDVSTKELTLAELHWAVANQQLTVDQYTARLLGLGYAPADVAILVAHHAPAPAAPGG